MVCFVDDQRVMGSSEERVQEAGHTLSTRESYLGLQDALEKVRTPRGVRQPGAWARANMCIGEDGDVMVLTSQEKWDQLKAICLNWLGIIGGGKTELEFERLRSDQGFLVYVTQAYPGMKPYLKGFNLSLETWREGRDEDGWKLQPRKPRDINQEEEKDDHKGKPEEMESVKIKLVAQTAMEEENRGSGPPMSKLLHELILRLKKAEICHGFILHLVHVAGTQMIAQGTDGLSRGLFLEGVLAGRDMLAFVDMSLPAIRQHLGVIELVQSWVEPVIGRGRVLKEEEWFVEGHSIIGGCKDAHGIWIPMHAKNGRAYI
jgi:hypothetical protein